MVQDTGPGVIDMMGVDHAPGLEPGGQLDAEMAMPSPPHEQEPSP